MTTPELFLIAMAVIFIVPFLIWRLLRTDYFAPLVVVQILMGIALGPGIGGRIAPDFYHTVFNAAVIQTLNGIAMWAVMLFVCIAGVELDLKKTWQYRKESGITAGLALGMPLAFGCIAGWILLNFEGWTGDKGAPWQFVVGVGMSCAVTALPILMLFLEKMEVLRNPLGQRILRYASLDDIAIWGVLALILLDWERMSRQALFLTCFTIVGYGFRWIMKKVPEDDRWYGALMWLAVCGFAADWAGLHYMVGAFLAGAVMDREWFNLDKMDMLRDHVLLVLMPVFFLSTGLRTDWAMGGSAVLLAAALLLVVSVAGKLAGVHIAGKILGWQKGEASLIGWLLQTKALIMIIFANILLDKHIITDETFTALLLMAVASTMLTIPFASPILRRVNANTASQASD